MSLPTTLVCALHTAQMTGSAVCCLDHIHALRDQFDEVQLVLEEHGPLVDTCREQNIACTVVPLVHRGLRSAPPSLRSIQDLYAVLKSRLAFLRRVRRLLKASHCIVHIHSSAAIFSAMAARLSGRPVVMHVRECRRPGYESRLRAFVAVHCSNIIITVSEGIRKNYGPRFRCKSRTVHDFCTAPDAQRAASHVNVRPRSPTIALVGHVSERKGISEFLQICASLHRRGCHFRAELIGSYHSDELRRRCERFIEEHGLRHIVSSVGFVADADILYSRVDILVHPALWDPLPHVIMEAMIRGIPVVASNVDGIPEIVEHGTTGFMAGPGDIEQLSSHVQTLLDEPTLRETFGKHAQARVREHFRSDNYIEQLVGIYEDVSAS